MCGVDRAGVEQQGVGCEPEYFGGYFIFEAKPDAYAEQHYCQADGYSPCGYAHCEPFASALCAMAEESSGYHPREFHLLGRGPKMAVPILTMLLP